MNLKIVICIISCLLIISIFIILFKKENKKKFLRDVNYLRNHIKDNAEKQTDITTKSRLENLLKFEIKNEYDLEELRFLYHGGLFRTQEEIYEYRETMNRSKYDKQRHSVNTYVPLVTFVSVFCLTFFGIKDLRRLPLVGIPFAFIPAGFAAVFSAILGYSINISSAKDYDIPDYDPMVQEEKLKQKTTILAGMASSAHTYHHTKKALKEISDPDTWKSMQ